MPDLTTIQLVIPPGLSTNESALAAANRYVAMQGMRFWRAMAEKLGGNIALTTDANAVLGETSALHTWNDLTSRQLIAAASEQELVVYSTEDYVKQVITPAGLATGLKDPSSGAGWGAGTWDDGTWDTPRTTGGISYRPRQWSLDNFGKVLIASCSDDTIYQWDPTALIPGAAQAIPGAPSRLQGSFVTSENTVVCYGTNFGGTQDLMQFWTSGQNTFDDFDTTRDSSTAGGSKSIARRLRQGTRIVSGCDLANLSHLLWTDNAVYLNQYTGSLFVYTTKLLGDRCGLLGPHAFCTAGGVAYWISVNSLLMYDGSVKQIPGSDEIVQELFSRVRPFFTVKGVAFFNDLFNEVWFGLVVDSNTVPTLWAFYSTITQKWGFHEMPRTAASAFKTSETRPLLMDTDGLIRQHETGHDDNGAPLPWSITLSTGEFGDGSNALDIWHYVPDFQRQKGPVSVRIQMLDRTSQEDIVIDEMTRTVQPGERIVDFQVSGRSARITLYSHALGSDIRFGLPKLLGTPAGERP